MTYILDGRKHWNFGGVVFKVAKSVYCSALDMKWTLGTDH